MNTRPPGHPLVLTTESRSGHVRRFAVRTLHGVTIGALAFVILGADLPFKDVGRGAAAVIAVLIALGAVSFILSPLLSRSEVRGTWIIEPDSVSFAPADGRTRTLGWDDVDRVRVRSDAIDLRAGERHLEIGGRMLDGRQWDVLSETLESRLGDRFDCAAVRDSGRWWLLGRPVNIAVLSVIAAWLHATSGLVWPAYVVILLAIGLTVAGLVWSRRSGWIFPQPPTPNP